MAERNLKLIIDCDPGHDDALALILAHYLAEVVGITTVSGNAALEAVTTNALAVVELIGAETPVHSGASGPLVNPADGSAPHATHVHGALGLSGAELAAPVREVASTDAVEFLLETSRAHPGAWLVAIGPLTNVAAAIEQDPDWVGRLAGISIMGGSSVGGNVTASAEFNIWADPEAADVVFRSGAEIRLCGLNLTHQFRTTDALVARIRKNESAIAGFAADLMEYLHGRMESLAGAREAALHDPCAVLAVTHPQLFEFGERQVAIELAGELTRGMTVVDERRRPENQPFNVHVGYTINADAAMALLMDALDVAHEA